MAGNLIQPYSVPSIGLSNLNQLSLPSPQVNFQFWQKPVYQADDGSYWCPGFEGDTYATNPWDYLYIGIPSTQPFTPGLARVRLRKERSMDKKKPVGSDGARVTMHGVDPAEFDIELKIWTPEQLRALASLWPTLFPQAFKGSPPAYDVQHPLFSLHNVKSAQFYGGEGPEIQQDRSGIFRMRAVEFLKPSKKSATKTDVGAIGSLLDPGAYPTPSSTPSNLGPR